MNGVATGEAKAEKKSGEFQRYDLERALDKLGEGSKLLWLVFALTATPTLFNGFHATSYVFLAEVPTHWCAISALSATNWTDSQIRDVSSATSCTKYSYDYSYLAGLSFDDALAYAEANRNVSTERCKEFNYAEDTDGTSIVTEWDLVCDRAALRSSVQMALSLGKFIGATSFGVIADRFGRRVSYVTGVVMLILCGPTSAIVPWYWLFMILRGLTGASNAAIYHSSFTILSEVAGPKHRPWMGIVYSLGYPLGTMILPGLAYWTRDWQLLQLAITLPAVFLLIHCWLMPESPRWLISQNRCEEAKIIIEKINGPLDGIIGETASAPRNEKDDEKYVEKNSVTDTSAEKTTFWARWNKIIVLYTNTELRKRIFISYVAWAASALSYYAIALNVDNFSADRYLYVLFTGLSEMPAYLLPIPLLAWLGRRMLSVLLFLITGVTLLGILLIPQSYTVAVMVVALTGRLTVSAVFTIMILYTSELFPTIARNSAVGTSSTMAHIGSMSAPYVVDLLGAESWWIPSTLCGATALISGVLVQLLPETKGRPLADTVEEEIAEGRGKVSVRNCCSFK